ncbi:hypothetical protein SAMN05421874_106315 [Nonomuraea maritima]|uniref:Uncharacterized protein n=1 Tax=Nonomuraea maritima TaxID=683260 RepID=A0A1G9ARK2_9ACTN|nr:hypothetical protein SAMN05421874_106315 [Nonomuraea maritima]
MTTRRTPHGNATTPPRARTGRRGLFRSRCRHRRDRIGLRDQPAPRARVRPCGGPRRPLPDPPTGVDALDAGRGGVEGPCRQHRRRTPPPHRALGPGPRPAALGHRGSLDLPGVTELRGHGLPPSMATTGRTPRGAGVRGSRRPGGRGRRRRNGSNERATRSGCGGRGVEGADIPRARPHPRVAAHRTLARHGRRRTTQPANRPPHRLDHHRPPRSPPSPARLRSRKSPQSLGSPERP